MACAWLYLGMDTDCKNTVDVLKDGVKTHTEEVEIVGCTQSWVYKQEFVNKPKHT
jgi:hypothetical protein